MDSSEALKSKKDESTSSSSQPSPASQNLHDLGGCIQSPEATSDSVGTIISSSSLPSKISEESASLAPSSAVAISRSRECSMISKKMKYKGVIPPYKPGTRTTISVSTINKNRLIDASAAAESPRFTTEPFTSSSHTEAAAATIHDDNKKTSTTDHAGNSQKLVLPRSNSKKSGPFPCACKWSKCVNLHCACFAGELYCGQNCSCRGCSNRPEFQDKIHEIRQEIISRDPLHLQCYEPGEADPPSRDWTRNPSGSYSFAFSLLNPLPTMMPFATVPRSRETTNPQAVPSFSPESKHKVNGEAYDITTRNIGCICREADPPSRDWTRNPSGSYSFTCSRFNPLPPLMPFAAVPRSRETSNPQAVPSFSPESKHKVNVEAYDITNRILELELEARRKNK